MAATATEKPVTLRILIDEEKNKVVYALAGKDFVDILLSFLTFPLGTIARLLSKESDMKNVNVGSLNTLYESVANLGVEHFWSETCKEMLLQPRNSMEAYCQNLKHNIDDTEEMKFFICQEWLCSCKESGSSVSLFKNKKCKCGKVMNREISPMVDTVVNRGGFVQDQCSFIIFDNLKVIPDNFQNCISLPMSFGSQDFNGIKVDIVVNVTSKEIVDILKCSLVSDTPLTDYFLSKKMVDESFQPRSSLLFNTLGDIEDNDREEFIKLKVIVRKSKIKVLYAVVEADFVDIIFSFLTFPLGGVENIMKGNSCLGSIDNLYNSVVDLDCHKYLKSHSLKDKLVKTPLAQQFKHQKQILPIDEAPISYNSCFTLSNITNCKLTPSDFSGTLTNAEGCSRDIIDIHGIIYLKSFAPLSYVDPQSSTFQPGGSGKGFVKSNSIYMVTDDLIVTTTSSMSLVSLLAKSNISSSDLEEKVISIGRKECLSILKASLTSSSALTDGLGQFLYPIKEEKIG